MIVCKYRENQMYTLREKVMKLSYIQVPQYYEKGFKAAEQQHFVTTTLDKAGRVVVITTPT